MDTRVNSREKFRDGCTKVRGRNVPTRLLHGLETGSGRAGDGHLEKHITADG